ncbi:MAG: helix-turn-helix transcriptional regulator [Clostridium sp.]|uniref:helix-turn-helix transcriptional regulator n=1 Tax=Clostridium sp. TaxID=1506 RepID=UPI003027EB86
MNKLGYKIKTLRKLANLTQEDLSCNILNRTSLSKIENGNLSPSISQLEHISSKLKISVTDLLKEDYAEELFLCSNKSNIYIEDLYNNEKYFNIIEKIKPFDFITHYYLGMSYYKIELKDEAENYLNKCEDLFNKLSENDKLTNVENLCIALNSLRKIKIKNFSNNDNLVYLEKPLNYLNLYNKRKCEIFFIINNNIGAYYFYSGDYEKCISFLEDLLKNNFKINPPTVLCSIHFNLSIAYFSIKDYDKSTEHIKKSMFFYNYIDNILESRECYINLFNSYLYSNNTKGCNNLLKFLFENYKDDKLIERYKVLELNFLYNINNINSILDKSKNINYRNLENKTKLDYDFILGRVNFILGNYTASRCRYNKCLNALDKTEKFLDLSLSYADMFKICGNNEYNMRASECKILHENQKYNHMHPNITSPHYFSYFNKS